MKKHLAVGILISVFLLVASGTTTAQPLAGIISGRVINSNGSGIGGAQVVIDSGVDTTTDGNGYYSRSVNAATYYVVVRAPSGYANAYASSVIVSDGGITSQNFILSSNVGTINGRVYDANTNAPLANVPVLAQGTPDTGNNGWSNAVTDSNGNYTLTKLAAGHYAIGPVPPPSGYNGVTLMVNVNAGNNTLDLGLGRSGSAFVGRVTTTSGVPVANAHIFAGDPNNPNSTCYAATDSNGNYNCGLGAGNYLVHLVESGYPGQILTVSLSSGQTRQVNFVTTSGSQTISGQVRSYQLNPINGAFIEADQQIANGPGYYRTVYVGSNGNYSFSGIGNQGTYQFQIGATGYARRLDDQVSIAGNPWTRNFKLGTFFDVAALDDNNRVEFPFYYIEFMQAHHIISGFTQAGQCPGTTAPCFLPSNNVRRGEYSKMLALAKGWATNISAGPHFRDVSASNTFYNQIETAYHNGAISGYADGTFRPNGTITRAEATKLAVAASGWTLLNPSTASYSDVPTTYWAYRWIETAHSHGAIANDSAGFRPGDFILRSETAKLICVANASGCGQ